MFKRILAVIDPTSADQKALGRACHLARLNQASVTAFLCIYDFSYEMTTMLSAEERDAMRTAVIEDKITWINDILADPRYASVDVDIKVVWHNRPYEAIIKEILANDYDTLVKSTHAHDTLKSVIFTPTDWHLLRKSPVPVLLVKEHDWPENGEILAAINAGTEDDSHQQLNEAVTEHAKLLANIIHGKVNLVNSYPATPVNIAIEIPEFDADAYNESIRKHHDEALSRIAQSHGIDANRVHLGEGLPEDVIPAVASNIDAELVVLGTIGRTGLSAALIGNTAEHVIDELNCDVLALKPEGFVSPVLLDE